MNLLGIMISYILVSNIVLTGALGAGSLVVNGSIVRSQFLRRAVFSACMILVTAVLGWTVKRLLLVPLHGESLTLLVFSVLVCGIAVLLMHSGKVIPVLNMEKMELSLIHLMGDGLIMGLLLITATENYGFGMMFMAACGTALGFILIALVLGTIQERMKLHASRRYFKGLPVLLISLGLMALTFLAFDSSLLNNLNLM